MTNPSHDPGFIAAADQMASAIRDVASASKVLRAGLRDAGFTRRQRNKVVEAWITHLLTLAQPEQ